ncbi:MAG: hypothetical protein ABGX07_18005, partial [Pirellulaceae bacterium]
GEGTLRLSGFSIYQRRRFFQKRVGRRAMVSGSTAHPMVGGERAEPRFHERGSFFTRPLPPSGIR